MNKSSNEFKFLLICVPFLIIISAYLAFNTDEIVFVDQETCKLMLKNYRTGNDAYMGEYDDDCLKLKNSTATNILEK